MGIYIKPSAKEEIISAAVACAQQAVEDYRHPGCHVIGYDSTRIDITDGAQVEIIAICFDKRRIDDLKSNILEDLYQLLESEAQ